MFKVWMWVRQQISLNFSFSDDTKLLHCYIKKTTGPVFDNYSVTMLFIYLFVHMSILHSQSDEHLFPTALHEHLLVAHLDLAEHLQQNPSSTVDGYAGFENLVYFLATTDALGSG